MFLQFSLVISFISLRYKNYELQYYLVIIFSAYIRYDYLILVVYTGVLEND